MKKIYIVMAVIATAALVSCEREKSFDDENLGENSVVFAIRSGSTRSAQVVSEAQQGIVIPLVAENGSQFVLEETVTSLDQFSPATKGTPAYTENLGTLYANDLNVWGDAGGFGTNATYVNMENELYPRKDTDLGSGWRYNHDYNGDPWPSEDGDVGFYLNMPAAPTGVSITGHTGGKFTFTYTSPSKAADQQDILFAYRVTNKAKYLENFHPNGIPVLFNHALTAVKFRIGNDGTDITTNKIKITKITFKNLVDKGTCTITPASEDNYKDNESTYSSATAASWTNPSSSGADITSDTISGTVEYKASDKKFGESWYGAEDVNTQNLNDADATQTFWLVPQAFDASSTVKLEIMYDINGTTGNKWEIDFGKFLAGATWKAGELRTYTIKINDVNLKIEDTVSDTKKENIVITNTGNTAAFIRASIVGQWLDYKGRPVFGFTDLLYEFHAVESWYEDQFVKTAPGTHGKFTDLAGYKGANNPLNGWYLCTDGYYYYEHPVEPTKVTGYDNEGTYVQQKLFTSYEVGTAPKVTISGVNTNIHFSLEISTQAVSANKLDGSAYEWQDAWENATGTKPTIKN